MQTKANGEWGLGYKNLHHLRVVLTLSECGAEGRHTKSRHAEGEG